MIWIRKHLREKSVKKKSGSFYCIKWYTLPPEGHKVTLPPSNKGEQEIFRDVKGCNWIQNVFYPTLSGITIFRPASMVIGALNIWNRVITKSLITHTYRTMTKSSAGQNPSSPTEAIPEMECNRLKSDNFHFIKFSRKITFSQLKLHTKS